MRPPAKIIKHRERMQRLLDDGVARLDTDELARLKSFIRVVQHWKEPFSGMQFIPEPWQMDELLIPLLCYKRADGTRLFRTAYIQLPRKNGKSFLAAVILLYVLLSDGGGLEIYTAATKADQAKIVFHDCCNIINASAALKKRLRVWKTHIEYQEKSSVIKPLSADRNSLDGLNSSALCLDEVHKMDRGVHDVLVTSTGARRQPLVLKITTAGDDETGVCYDEYTYSSKILDGVIDENSYFALIYEADADIDWQDPEAYRQANPNLGVSVGEDHLERELRKSMEVPSYRTSYQRYHLNRWVQNTGVSWLPIESWNQSRDQFTADDLVGEPCWAGLDIGSTTDLTCMSMLFPRSDGSFRLITQYWMPSDNLWARVQEDRVPYNVWEEQGWLETTPGNVVDAQHIAERVVQASQRFRIQSLSYDPAFSFNIFPTLMQEGIEVREFKQNLTNYHPPSQQFETLFLGGKLRHDGNPVTRWCVSNVAVYRSYDGRMKPEKSSKNARERIDGVVASIMALDGWMRMNGVDSTPQIDYSKFGNGIRSMLGI